MELTQRTTLATTIMNGTFLMILNVVLMSIIGYLTLDSEANLNSRVGAVFLSFSLPMCIVIKTQHLSALERLLKFGAGFIMYIILAIIIVGFPVSFITGLIPCLVAGLATLYYGEVFLQKAKNVPAT